MAFIAMSALCYSLVGCLYELLVSASGPSINHVNVRARDAAAGVGTGGGVWQLCVCNVRSGGVPGALQV